MKLRALDNADNNFSVKTYWQTLILTYWHHVETPD